MKEVSIEEIVKWESIVGYDGALGGSHGAIHQRWMEGDDFDGIRNEDIKKAMEYDRFLGIKRVFKLNDNAEAPTDKNDPAYATAKFDFIAQVVVHNTNAITKKAEDDLCVDETTCAYGGYGPSGTGLCRKGLKKPGASKGIQTTIVTDAHRPRPRAVVHRHKIHEDAKPSGWTNGEYEMKLILDQLDKHVEGSAVEGKKLFSTEPHLTSDNY